MLVQKNPLSLKVRFSIRYKVVALNRWVVDSKPNSYQASKPTSFQDMHVGLKTACEFPIPLLP